MPFIKNFGILAATLTSFTAMGAEKKFDGYEEMLRGGIKAVYVSDSANCAVQVFLNTPTENYCGLNSALLQAGKSNNDLLISGKRFCLNSKEPNYKVLSSAVFSAYLMDKTVKIYANEENGVCSMKFITM